MKIYAARDEDGRLFLYYGGKPSKLVTFWIPNGLDYCETVEDLPTVKWEDAEPTEVYFDDYDSHKLKIK